MCVCVCVWGGGAHGECSVSHILIGQLLPLSSSLLSSLSFLLSFLLFFLFPLSLFSSPHLLSFTLQELSPTSDANLVRSLMNLCECQMDEFKDEQKFKQLTPEQVEAWIMVGRVSLVYMYVRLQGSNRTRSIFRHALLKF